MATLKASVTEWNCNDVQKLLCDLHLDDCLPAFRKNGVDGNDLLGLSDNELAEDLGMTKLQIKKLRKATGQVQVSDANSAAQAVTVTATDLVCSPTSNTAKPETMAQLFKYPVEAAGGTPASGSVLAPSTPVISPAASVKVEAASTPYIPDQAPPAPTIAPATPAKVDTANPSDSLESSAKLLPRDLVTSYKTTQREINELIGSHIQSKLAEAQQQLTADKDRAEKAAETVRSLQGTLQTERKQLKEGSEGWHLGKMVGGPADKAHKEKMAGLQQTIKDHESQYADARATLRALQAAVQSSGSTVQKLQQQVSHLQALQQQQESRKAQMFNDMSDATLRRLAADIAAITPQLTDAQQRRATNSRALSLLSAAQSKLVQAAEQFQKACGIAGANAMGSVVRVRHNTLGAEMGNMIEMQAFQAGAQLVEAARGDVMQAKQLVPTMPDVSMPPLGQMEGMMGAVMFNNVISDMRVRRSAEENVVRVRQMVGSVDCALAWMRNGSAADAAAVASLESLKAAKCAEHKQRCERILQRALELQNDLIAL